MTTTGLTPAAEQGLYASVVLLRDTTGFMFLPLFVESERAAAAGLAFLQSKLGSKLYDVAWPLGAPSTPSTMDDSRQSLLRNLDDAIAKLPPNAMLVVDASSSLRHALALAAVAYLNHRREPLRAAGLRLLLCWPIGLKDELLARAPDLWSVRGAAVWVEETDLDLALLRRSDALTVDRSTHASPTGVLTAEQADMFRRWQDHRDLQAANLSEQDALNLARALIDYSQSADAAELAEAVISSIGGAGTVVSSHPEAVVDALNVLGSARAAMGNFDGGLQATELAVRKARLLAAENPSANNALLARSISNLASGLSAIGDRAGALKSGREAVAIFRPLSLTHAPAYESDLASSLSNLAGQLSKADDDLGALVPGQEAVAIYRRLAKTNPQAYEPALALTLQTLATYLNQTGDQTSALAACNEALQLFEETHRRHPGLFEAAIQQAKNLRTQLSQQPQALAKP